MVILTESRICSRYVEPYFCVACVSYGHQQIYSMLRSTGMSYPAVDFDLQLTSSISMHLHEKRLLSSYTSTRL